MKQCGALLAMALLFASAAQAQTDAVAGWITATNQACKIWNPAPQPDESVTWSGACKDGLATGKGILQWTENGKPDVKFDGEYVKGKRNGPGVLITPDGRRTQGMWVDDEPFVPNGDTI